MPQTSFFHSVLFAVSDVKVLVVFSPRHQLYINKLSALLQSFCVLQAAFSLSCNLPRFKAMMKIIGAISHN